MSTINRKTTTNGTLTALAAAGLLAAAGTAQASFTIDIAQQSQQSAQDYSGAAYDAQANYLSGLDSSTTEDFETGFAHNQKNPSTAVGAFSQATGRQGTGTQCTAPCDTPRVFDENEVVSDEGRYDTTGPDGDFYLDSNDVPQVKWDVVEGYNSVGFFLTDPNDEGAEFSIRTEAGTAKQFSVVDTNQDDGELFYVSISSDEGSNLDSLFFENLDENTNDGFGIDDPTVGVPAPGMLAMLGSGLMALGLFGRVRGRGDNA